MFKHFPFTEINVRMYEKNMYDHNSTTDDKLVTTAENYSHHCCLQYSSNG